jgi:hypothetical protein
MLQSTTGTYENVIVQLTKIPPNIRSSKVIVTFMDSIDANPINQFITFIESRMNELDRIHNAIEKIEYNSSLILSHYCLINL